MKKIVMVMLLVLILCGCTKKEILKNVSIGNYSNISEKIYEYKDTGQYVLLEVKESFEEGYTKYYSLYRDIDTNYINKEEKYLIASFEIKYNKVDHQAEIEKILYTFPNTNDESFKNINIEEIKTILKVLLKGLITNGNIEEILEKLNYPTNDQILNGDEEYNKTKYIVYLDKEKTKKMQIDYNEKEKNYVFEYKID